ncbi:hypothetical protein [Cellulosimicrobium sp. TH-20]|uniref:hypothetical protein n=1 Tax=Cellulosimicrobium sp. TH-20 TaxID=1980001 RepID=UPI00119F2AC7|nr:hypothetical protein [Cellulosimicrobium sp. TH-20]
MTYVNETNRPTAAAIEEAAAYENAETGACMRKVVVFTNPTTGAQARRYRPTSHLWVSRSTSSAEVLDECIFCHTIA